MGLRFAPLAAFLAVSLSAPVALPSAARAQAAAPGGFVEPATSTEVRARVTPPLPARGKFTFPAPYGTVGVRLTNATDCGGADCVNYVGYSYWRNTNNHAGSDTMLAVVTLDRNRGGAGPTLFRYDKRTDDVAVVGPLFDAGSALSWATGEGWYFSATRPSALYLNQGARLLRYDVLARTFETVFDAAPEFGPDRVIWQMHSSDDDRVHSATLKSSATWEALGCLVYREDTGAFSYFERLGDYDECQIDRSGRWLVIKENVDGVNGEDNRIIDVASGAETLLLDPAGAGGHSDAGHGYLVATDNWNAVPGAVRVWDLAQPIPGTLPQGRLVYRTTDWRTDIGHVSHTNARPGTAAEQQYACGGGASRLSLPRANEIVCFRLDSSLDVLVVAPNLTDLDAPGGRDDYGKLPKGNLDVTGQYFVWTGNAGGNRLDAFIVRVPSALLLGGDEDTGGGDTGGPPADSAFADAFGRADSTQLGASWQEVQGDLRIQAGELRNAAAKGIHLAVVPWLDGATQAVAADFASVSNSGGPTFGVVLRYQDARNYYLAYRRAGGSSVLRISRVRDGVETVLKRASVRNPRLNQKFRIAGRASGTTLVLELDGVAKVTVSDAAFGAGAAGIALGPGSGSSSQRVDDFTASVQ